jgi:hypothetical protein
LFLLVFFPKVRGTVTLDDCTPQSSASLDLVLTEVHLVSLCHVEPPSGTEDGFAGSFKSAFHHAIISASS